MTEFISKVEAFLGDRLDEARKYSIEQIQNRSHWLVRLQAPDGIANLEARLGHPIPLVIQEFWKTPWLVLYADSLRWSDFFISTDWLPFNEEPPSIVNLANEPFLLVNWHPHSGMVGAVKLNSGDDPPIFLGFGEEFDDDEAPFFVEHFSNHLLASLELPPKCE